MNQTVLDKKGLRVELQILRELATQYGVDGLVNDVNRTYALWTDRKVTADDLERAIQSTKIQLYSHIGLAFDAAYQLCSLITPLLSKTVTAPTFAQDDRYTSTTEFFRDVELFKELPHVILEHFPDGCDVLSVGCSDGKEVFSTIITLAEVYGFEKLSRYRFSGIDINEPVLRQASSGWVVFTPKDLFKALNVGVSLEVVEQALFSRDTRCVHPIEPVFRNQPGRSLIETEFAIKESLVGEAAVLFTNGYEYERETIISYLVNVASLPCSVEFSPGSAIDAVNQKCKAGKPFVLMARNMLYHLMSDNSTDVVRNMENNVAPNASLLFADIPKGTVIVVGATDIKEGKITPALFELGFSVLPGSECGHLFLKIR